MVKKAKVSKSLLVLIGSVLISFLLYFPVLGNTFLSDDYDSLYRILVEKQFLYKNFLRPVIDISFYFNYLLSGNAAWSYYAFNILVHAFNGWLLYKLAVRFTMFEASVQQQFAIFAAFLFLVYPFHSEGIVWLSGRLSSIATSCALLALCLEVRQQVTWTNRLLAIVVYLVGLHAYESILLLPVLIIVLKWRPGMSVKSLRMELIVWGGIMLLYLGWRYYISGVVYNEYAERMVDGPVLKYLAQALKTIGRTLLPPVENSQRLIVMFGVVMLLLVFIHMQLYRRLKGNRILLTKYVQLMLAFLVTLLIPILFGVSTRTSEGDRLLYLPSCFLCIMLSLDLVVLVKYIKKRLTLLLLLAMASVYYTVQNNQRWVQASLLTKEVITAVDDARSRPIVLVNLPEELEGAFVFRNGFYHALIINGIDTGGVHVSHYLSRLEAINGPATITPEEGPEETFIYPSTYLTKRKDSIIEINGSQNRYIAAINKHGGILYYWNNRSLVRLF